MSEKIFSWKRVTVGVLAGIILASWGFAIYSYYNPPIVLVHPADQAALRGMVYDMCTSLKDEYEDKVREDGTMLIEDGEHLLGACINELAEADEQPSSSWAVTVHPVYKRTVDTSDPDELYHALVKEFERIQ